MPTAALSQNQAPPAPRPDLDRMRPLLAALGDPQQALRAVHVGGTNGKGSVCALLGAILRASGYRVGRYTSPHLEAVTERFWFDGADIAPRALEALLAEVRAAAAGVVARGEVVEPYAEFDLLTAAAFRWFATRQPDVAVVEVGLGGAADATNVLDDPLLTVVTNVSMDHTALLGHDEEAIARVKAGIIKKGRPVLTQASGRAYRVVAGVARERQAHLRQADFASYVSPLPAGQRIAYRGRLWELGLLGTYQLQNSSLVLEAVEVLRAEGLAIPDEAVRQGLLELTWPGRMEASGEGGSRWLYDGAHNLAGAAELVASLRRHFPGEELVLVFGTLDDKPAAQMLRPLLPLAGTVILTAPPAERALAPGALAAGLRHDDLRVEPDPTAAITTARRAAGGRLVLVCGSLYLVGLARSCARKLQPS